MCGAQSALQSNPWRRALFPPSRGCLAGPAGAAVLGAVLRLVVHRARAAVLEDRRLRDAGHRLRSHLASGDPVRGPLCRGGCACAPCVACTTCLLAPCVAHSALTRRASGTPPRLSVVVSAAANAIVFRLCCFDYLSIREQDMMISVQVGAGSRPPPWRGTPGPSPGDETACLRVAGPRPAGAAGGPRGVHEDAVAAAPGPDIHSSRLLGGELVRA